MSRTMTTAEAIQEARRCLNCARPTCRTGCPIENNIPGFIRALSEGNIGMAYEIISERSNLPAICGRVCPHERQCEAHCVLTKKKCGIEIGSLEMFIADFAHNNDLKSTQPSSKLRGKVAVIGSGPAGLACAADLAKWGYGVTIFEALHKAGGVLEYGIPEFRLPKEKVLRGEIEDVLKLGVKIETDVVVGRTVTVDSLLDRQGFAAVFIGTGAGLPKFMNIPGENLCGVFSANEFLTRNNLMCAYREDYMTPIHVGRKVCVVGGGNVAMDAARTALRLGAEVHVVYRRTEAELPARKEEVHHAMQEGIIFDMLTNPVEIIGNEKGWVSAMKCIKMELGEPDASGRRSPVPVEGSEFEIETDTVIMALGTSSNPLIAKTTAGLETTRRGGIVTDETGETSRPGVFAGGDAVTGAATVILAMGAGRTAAKAIDNYIKNHIK